MAAPESQPLPLEEQVRQLNEARKLAFNDVSYFPTIVQGILPIIGPSAAQELRRWGAEFLSEAFATPALPSREKESLGLLVLDTIKNMLDDSKGDVFVQRSAVMSASSLYPLVLHWV
jgi:symplekin